MYKNHHVVEVLRGHISYTVVHLDKKMGLLWSPAGNVKSKNMSTSLSLSSMAEAFFT